ncbi:MAG: UDP-N-acetylglucosamine 2-epimerase, partial [Thermoproteota archaeon]|nr:UDP-N-acetylglucosamine 2-epimerase [Thermoproteota archaeon]
MSETELIDSSNRRLPIEINKIVLTNAFENARALSSRLIAIVIGTKPDFYKQAPLIREVIDNDIPAIVIDSGQHFDDLVGFGKKEFSVDDHVACSLKIRGDLVEKASDLLTKFAKFGRMCKMQFPTVGVVPIVHGDTLVAGIAPLAWAFGLGQKVAQNEAGLRSMAPVAVKDLRVNFEPSNQDVESFANRQFNGKWFLAREEPYPEQIDTWICSAGTQYFFAPTELNKKNLIREGYPEDSIHVVGNSIVDAINLKRREKPQQSIFDLYPRAEIGDWIRVDIHRRENLTKIRFSAIINGIIDLVKLGYKILFIKMNATQYALDAYGFSTQLDKLADLYPNNFIQTPLWKKYGHVVEFLDSGHCWAELTDSGSMQEELMYFSNVLSLTLRLSTDRPETVFEAKGNMLVPPINHV